MGDSQSGWEASIAAVLLGLLTAGAGAAPATPDAPSGRVVESENSLRAFGKAPGWEAVGDLTARWEGREAALRYRALTLGGYVRAHANLKLGAFYRLQQGARHDDDWRPRFPGATIWEWEDTRQRSEHVLILDATPRVQLRSLPGGNWVFFLKNRYLHNTFNGQGTFQLAPELAHFWMRGLRPLATVYLRGEFDLALNHGTRTVVDQWYYLGGLWHVRPWLSIGPHAALREWVWGTSRSWRERAGGVEYRVLHRSVVLGATVVGRFGP